MKTNQVSMAFDSDREPTSDWLQLEQIITDRGSKYSVTVGRVTSNEALKVFLKKVKTPKAYAKATHNTYAARVRNASQIFEVKNDDGETGAGMVILRQLRKYQAVDIVVVVTRWYGGVKLQGDRFRHVQEATRMGLEKSLGS